MRTGTQTASPVRTGMMKHAHAGLLKIMSSAALLAKRCSRSVRARTLGDVMRVWPVWGRFDSEGGRFTLLCAVLTPWY